MASGDRQQILDVCMFDSLCNRWLDMKWSIRRFFSPLIGSMNAVRNNPEPFHLLIIPNKRSPFSGKKVSPESGSLLESLKTNDPQVLPACRLVLYPSPHGLGVWFWFFLLAPLSLLVSKMIECGGVFHRGVIPSFIFFVSAIVITWVAHHCIYRVFNHALFERWWHRWKEEYRPLFEVIPHRSLASSKNKVYKPFLAKDLLRRKVCYRMALREFYNSDAEAEINPAIKRFYFFWMAPSVIIYAVLFGWYIASYLFSIWGVTFCDQKLYFAANDLLISIIIWWLLSICFLFVQSKHLNPARWRRRAGVWAFPSALRSYVESTGRSALPQDKNNKHALNVLQLLALIQSLIFGIYIALLSFLPSPA